MSRGRFSDEVRSVLSAARCAGSEETRYCVIRATVLVLLSAQNCALMIVTSYSRSRAGPKYLASTAVVASEFLKTAIVFSQLFCSHGARQVLCNVMPRHVLSIRTMRYAVPALFYTVQNNLLYFAMDNLDSVAAAVTSQLKVLTTAIFSVAILGKRLSYVHWFGLLVLIFGLIIMQSDGKEATVSKRFYLGLLAMTAACTSSGFAGVSLEVLFKQQELDIWVANLQLQLFCLPVAVLGIFSDLQGMRGQGVLAGWDGITCLVVALNALGGFLVSFTMKYADNMLKTFAVSMSLVVNCLISSVALSVELSLQSIFGVLLVIASTWLYSIGGRFLSPVVSGTKVGLSPVLPGMKVESRSVDYTPVKTTDFPSATPEEQVKPTAASKDHDPYAEMEGGGGGDREHERECSQDILEVSASASPVVLGKHG